MISKPSGPKLAVFYQYKGSPLLSWIKYFVGQQPRRYEERFEQALRHSKALGLASPGFSRTEGQFASEHNLQVFQQVVEAYLCDYHAEEVSQQCFAVTLMLKAPLEEALGMPLAFTLGYVEYNGHNVFYSHHRVLKAMLKKGVPSPALNLHAWLTLPSHEVIDMTFGTTYGVVNQIPSVIGRMCFMHPEDMTADMQYHPQLVGEDYLERIGATHILLMPS
ncbi:hypothetical protein [Pseudomonas viridiflava]|uniref:hypothetical protein n=1 Tax=Pseudomonas viridiflava TaxID=33069 RepID=UPI002A6A9777|nr:hypothetical protein [Pseudomonas viridiflava]MDY0936247.1 hypothetical protein [Pseudomonas viridiflava]MDY1014133.1 hypothetical protein [Pseudomonas viridiflava]